MPQIIGIQTGLARRVKINGRAVLTAIYKQPVAGAVPVLPLGLMGDEQADLSVHGGLDKAVYAYPSEHYPVWRAARESAGLADIDDALPWGSMGENLTLSGLLEREVWVGDVLQFAHCALRVTLPREPCYKFNAAMGFNTASKTMAQMGCCGFYPDFPWWWGSPRNRWTAVNDGHSLRRAPSRHPDVNFYTISAGEQDDIHCPLPLAYVFTPVSCTNGPLFDSTANVRAQLNIGAAPVGTAPLWVKYVDQDFKSLVPRDLGGIGHYGARNYAGPIIVKMLTTECKGADCKDGFVGDVKVFDSPDL